MRSEIDTAGCFGGRPFREISSSGVRRILKKLQMNRLPSPQRYKRLDKRWQRYEKQQPGHRVQTDVKFVAPFKGSRTK